MDKPSRRPLGSATITQLGFGAAPLGNLYREMSDDVAHATLEAAWEQGVRFFDTAPLYGHGLSERRLGDFLRARPANEWVLSSKVGRLLQLAKGQAQADGFVNALPFAPVFDYSYSAVMRSYEASLQRLGLPRIDVLLMHDIGRLTHGERHDEMFAAAMDGFRAMRELRDAGAVRAIGIGVNEVEICDQVLANTDFDCLLLAGRYTLLEQNPADALLARCAARGVAVVVGGPYNSGILATGSRGAAPHFNYAIASSRVVERVRQIEDVCSCHDVNLPAAALQFCLAHPAVAGVVPGLANPREVAATGRFLDAYIPQAFWAELRERGLLTAEALVPSA